MLIELIKILLIKIALDDLTKRKVKTSTTLLFFILIIILTKTITLQSMIIITGITIAYYIGAIGPADLKILTLLAIIYPTKTLIATIISLLIILTQKNKKHKPLLTYTTILFIL